MSNALRVYWFQCQRTLLSTARTAATNTRPRARARSHINQRREQVWFFFPKRLILRSFGRTEDEEDTAPYYSADSGRLWNSNAD